MNAHTFRPDRAHLLAIIIMTGLALMIIAWAPLKLGWILIFPALAVWWVTRAGTRVDDSGIEAVYAFRSNKKIAWEDFRGIGFKGAGAYAELANHTRVTLPGVTFNSLPQLAEASHGRIPDALTAGQEAADNKVVVIRRDGEQILLTKEEFAEYQRQHPEATPE
ncbi:hypothetical protein CPHO_07270 [Corynebacterium phocae]|uniref:Low molecular weight protein antigen 6 PH domain-containing protein n=1 Tax=Corynebacterium phocae TaxID=161895 RepID=A0A1L7D3S2_9CORY|nr:PH domain-containing protein [Corynebacterium phocae]APT92723.1 hypothetical protein CPHO_07270 [Corynebacterium phocae]KAA8723031.1 PH domain-containing protein [Corynebacterium phocae]